MYEGHICSLASQWLYKYINLPPSGMVELIQTKTGNNTILEQSIVEILGVRVEE